MCFAGVQIMSAVKRDRGLHIHMRKWVIYPVLDNNQT